MITNFSIWKNKDKKTDTQPDYRIAAQINGDFVEIGAAWKKESKGESAENYISCSLSKPYKEKSGYRICEEKADTRVAPEDQGIRAEDITFDKPDDLL